MKKNQKVVSFLGVFSQRRLLLIGCVVTIGIVFLCRPKNERPSRVGASEGGIAQLVDTVASNEHKFQDAKVTLRPEAQLGAEKESDVANLFFTDPLLLNGKMRMLPDTGRQQLLIEIGEAIRSAIKSDGDYAVVGSGLRVMDKHIRGMLFSEWVVDVESKYGRDFDYENQLEMLVNLGLESSPSARRKLASAFPRKFFESVASGSCPIQIQSADLAVTAESVAKELGSAATVEMIASLSAAGDHLQKLSPYGENDSEIKLAVRALLRVDLQGTGRAIDGLEDEKLRAQYGEYVKSWLLEIGDAEAAAEWGRRFSQ